MHKSSRRIEEPLSGILDKAPKVKDSFGGVGGFVLMVLALLMARRRWPWVLGISAASGGAAKWAGWI